MNFLHLSLLTLFPDNEYNFERNLLNWYEIIIVVLVYLLINNWVNKKNKILYKKNFKLFFNLKIVGALIITLLFNLYYSGGDTTAYFNDGRLLNKVLFTNPSLAVEMFFSSGNPSNWSSNLMDGFDGFRFANDPTTWLVCKITAIIELFTFRSMLGTAMVFGFFSARLIWKFYETMLQIYPENKKNIALAVLFVPNVLLWGSGIFKDTVTLCLTMYAFVCLYRIFDLKKSILKNSVYLIICVFIVFAVKSYIIVSFLGCLSLWLASHFKIKSSFLRIVLRPFLVGLFAILAYIGFNQFTESFEKYQIDNVLETTKVTGEYLKYVAEKSDGSAYDIGTLEPSVSGLLKLAPAAINVTLFRPYIWEGRKIIIFFSALESTFILLFTLYVLFKIGPFRMIKIILKDKLLLSFLLFTLLFSLFVGLSSFNFGSLVRYKIPCIPIYLIVLSVALEKGRKKIILTTPQLI